MPDITVSIPFPVIVSPAYFKVRYRALPSGSFGAVQLRTNNPFTLTGLAVGDYEMEIIYVNADGIECEATYKKFTVIPDFSCTVMTAAIVQDPNNALFYLEISYGAIAQNPPCGWFVQYQQTGVQSVTIPYQALPTSPLRIPIANIATSVLVYGDSCNGKIEYCLEDYLEPINGLCDALVITETFLRPLVPASAGYTITIIFNQSNPITDFKNIIYLQKGVPVTRGTPLDYGTIVQPPPAIGGTPLASTSLTFTVNPINVVGQVDYDVQILDVCGNWHQFNVVY